MAVVTKLNDLGNGTEASSSDGPLGVVWRETEDLSRSGILARSLKVGEIAPTFALPNAVGDLVDLENLLQKGPVVITFYRGRWCPFCSEELQAYESALQGILKLGASVVAISPQTPDNSLSTVEKQNLTFEVLSDVHNVVAKKFGIVYHVQDEMQALYTDLGLDLPAFNGDHSFDLPVPATYVIDTDRVVRLAFVDPDYTRRVDPTAVLSVLQSLKNKRKN